MVPEPSEIGALSSALAEAAARAAVAEAKAAEAAHEWTVLANAEATILALRREIEWVRAWLADVRARIAAPRAPCLELYRHGFCNRPLAHGWHEDTA